MHSEKQMTLLRAHPGSPWKISAKMLNVTITRLGAPLLYARNASSFFARLRGLHAIGQLEPTEALVLAPCKAIHTFGLKRVIDVAFIDRDGVILKTEAVSPGCIAACLRAHAVIEMAPGTVDRIKLLAGQVLLPVARP